MFQSTTTNMNGGVTNAAAWQTMGFSGVPDPTYAHVFEDDFNFYNSFKYQLSGTGSTAPTEVSTLDGGAVLLTTGAVAGDSTVIQGLGGMQIAGFSGQPKATFFKVQFSLAAPSLTGLFCGLWNLGGAVGAETAGLVLESPIGSSQLELFSAVGGVRTSVLAIPNFNLVAGTMTELGFAIDTRGDVEVFINPGSGKSGYARNAPSPLGVVAGTPVLGRVGSVLASAVNLPSAILVPSFGISTGAAAETADLDFLVAIRER